MMQIPQWQRAEISLSSTQRYANPYHDVEVTATFTGPDGTSIVRPSFWDGGAS